MRARYLFPLLALGGCVSAGDMRQRSADASFPSTKSVDELSSCVGSRWASLFGAPVSTYPIERGVSFRLNGLGQADEMVDVVDLGERRELKVYFRKAPISFTRKRSHLDTLKGCA